MNKLLSFILMFALVIGFANATIIASDDFNRADSSTIGDGWTEIGSDGQTTIENNTAKITMAFSADAGFKYAYTTAEDPYTISLDVSSNSVPTAGGENALIVGVYQGNTLYGNIIAIQEDLDGVGFYYQNNTLGVGTPATYFAPFQSDVVYHIELLVQQSDLTMNITVDGQEYASVQIAGYSGITGIDGVGIQTANARNTNYWIIDNFLIQSSSTPPPAQSDYTVMVHESFEDNDLTGWVASGSGYSLSSTDCLDGTYCLTRDVNSYNNNIYFVNDSLQLFNSTKDYFIEYYVRDEIGDQFNANSYSTFLLRYVSPSSNYGVGMIYSKMMDVNERRSAVELIDDLVVTPFFDPETESATYSYSKRWVKVTLNLTGTHIYGEMYELGSETSLLSYDFNRSNIPSDYVGGYGFGTWNGATFDNITISEKVGIQNNQTPCTPDWSCSEYSSCMTTDTQECVAVTDLNTCGEAYAGDYSEFTPQSCNYCTSTYEGVDSSCGTNDIFNTTYTYTNSCCADTGLPSDCNIPSDFTTECNYCTISTSSHETACSGGFNTTYYTNDNAEVCCDLTGIPADCVVASNTTNVCETPTPPPITGYVPAHTSANIPQVVVDFGVEYGLQMIGMVGLIAVLGLGIWGFKTLKR